MKKVFNNIDDVSKLFIAQTQDFAGTPYTYIQGQGKGRRFYFKGDTIYSYRDSYPLARIVGNTVFIKPMEYSNTTKKHNRSVSNVILNSFNYIIRSDDLKTPNSYDEFLETEIKKTLNSRKSGFLHRSKVSRIMLQTHQPITESKFPLLFDKKHKKLRDMFFSEDIEIFNMAKKIIKNQKLI
jgi:hypothetical protein